MILSNHSAEHIVKVQLREAGLFKEIVGANYKEAYLPRIYGPSPLN